MILFPAIDIRGGNCVRLTQGDYNREQIFGDPIEMAMNWEKQGAEWLHVVDLDGALKGADINFKVISGIIQKVQIPVQVGGGIRSIENIEKYLEIGVERVILGSAAIYNSELVKEAVQKYGNRIAVSIDAKNGLVATDGWTKASGVEAFDFVQKLASVGVETIIYTDIAKDGMLNGPNFSEIGKVNSKTNLKLIASGGVSSHADLYRLLDLNVYGAIIGKALYTGDIEFVTAVKEVKSC